MVAKLFAIPVFGSFKTAKPSDYIQLVLDVSIKIVEVLNLEFQNSNSIPSWFWEQASPLEADT